MYIKKNAKVTFRSNRRSNYKRNNNFSNNKTRNKGNVTQQYNKYLKLAKEASSSGDRIQSEYYYQFTDHFYRLMLELGISLEEEGVNDNNKSADLSSGETNDESKDITEEKKDQEITNNEESNEESNEDIESIESIPFISAPVKKKNIRTKKVSV